MDRALDAISTNEVSDPDLQHHLARGAAIHGLVCVETYLQNRIDEWTTLITSARVAPSQLLGGTKQFEDRIVETLSRTLKSTEAGHRTKLLNDVGNTLLSLSSGSLIAHPLAMRWPGSNIQASDVESMLSPLGFESSRVWSELTGLWIRVDRGAPGNTSLKAIFEQVADLRHQAAHSDNPSLPIPVLLTLTRSVRLVCLCIDALASHGIVAMKRSSGKPQTKLAGSSVGVRKLVYDGGKWAEFAPNVKRARKRHDSQAHAMTAARANALAPAELVVAFDSGGEVIDWSYPAL